MKMEMLLFRFTSYIKWRSFKLRLLQYPKEHSCHILPFASTTVPNV